MRARNYLKVHLSISLTVLLMSGCSSLITEKRQALDIEDIIDMSKAGVGEDVIRHQIEVTRSWFLLDPDQIIHLKEEGIDDTIIEDMILTGESPEPLDWYYQYYFPHYCMFDYYVRQYQCGYPYDPHLYPALGYPFYVNPYTGVSRSKSVYIGLGGYYRYMPTYQSFRDYKRRLDRLEIKRRRNRE